MPAAVLPRWPLYWLVLLVANQSQGQTPVTYGDLAPILHSRCVLCHAGPQPPLDLALPIAWRHLLRGCRREAYRQAARCRAQ